MLGGQLETREIEHFIMNIFQLMKINDRDQPLCHTVQFLPIFCPHLGAYSTTLALLKSFGLMKIATNLLQDLFYCL